MDIAHIRSLDIHLFFLCFNDVRSMVSHLVLRMCSWPRDLVCEPAKTMEDAIEHFFSLMKTVKKQPGSITVGNAIAATHLLHLRQSRKPVQA